jgi:uncharacterized protein
MSKGQSEVTRNRFEVEVAGKIAYLEFETDGLGWMTIWHTEVPQELQGQGIASELSKTAFEYAKTNELMVDVICPLAANFVVKHPEYKSLVAKH